MMAALQFLKNLIHAALIRPLVQVLLRPGVRHIERLPRTGPAVIVANHNSHLDTLLLMSLFPLGRIDRIRPVAARDYFLRNPILAYCVTALFGVVPLNRRPLRRSEGDCLRGSSMALDRRDILIVFPEGTRGEPEQPGPFKTGIAHLARRHPDVPFVPVFLGGVGRALPKGQIIPVPSRCTVSIGTVWKWNGNRARFVDGLRDEIETMARESAISDAAPVRSVYA
ncbi:MAG: 1-acyl-sn-glycerol-3-phosphate acyltransferase [Gammaproteobacteria bacterium]|nr:1-acyl-sn-glycerol-3-phosphate acyltransferase [Gammaproteobacteria bacterium]